MNANAWKFLAIGSTLLVVYLLVRGHHSPSPSAADDDLRSSAQFGRVDQHERPRGRQAEQSDTIRRATLARIESLESDYRAIHQQLIAEKASQADYNRRVQDYCLQHSQACLALGFVVGGGGVLIQQNKSTTDGEKVLAGLAAGAGLVWAYQHADEANEVGKELARAVANQADYKKQVAALQHQVDLTAAGIEVERAKLR